MHIQAITSFTGKSYRQGRKYPAQVPEWDDDDHRGKKTRGRQFEPKDTKRRKKPYTDADLYEQMQDEIARGGRLTAEEQRRLEAISDMLDEMA